MTKPTAQSLQCHWELSKSELDDVAGGQKATAKHSPTPQVYFKITMQEVLISG